MGQERPETRKQVAEWLDISVSTLRNWDSRFQAWLEAEPGQKGVATKKRYTANDLVIFATIKRRLADGATFAEIETTLDKDIRGTVVNFAAEDGPASTGPSSNLPAISERERNAIVQAQQAREELAMASGRLQAIEDERNRLLEELEDVRAKLDEFRERAAAAEMAAEMLQSDKERRRWRWPWQRD